jgi:hypothetical protein
MNFHHDPTTPGSPRKRECIRCNNLTATMKIPVKIAKDKPGGTGSRVGAYWRQAAASAIGRRTFKYQLQSADGYSNNIRMSQNQQLLHLISLLHCFLSLLRCFQGSDEAEAMPVSAKCLQECN